MPTYLLEIGTEELPAEQVSEAQGRLQSLVSEALNQAGVDFDQVVTMGTPRRLACLVEGISQVQKTVNKRVKGPPVKSSFDASGKPLPSASGFAQKQGVKVEELLREEIGGVEYLVADVTIAGKPVAAVLEEIVPAAIMQLSGQRLMRWGDSDLKFSRPIRWLVSILDDKEIPIKLDSVKSGRETFGNRVLAPGKLAIASTKEYVAKLRGAKVLVCPQERKAFIEKQVSEAAGTLKGKARQLKGPLVEEVINILEWPHAVVGEFSKDYLSLPDTLIETIMVHHQRYFPVEELNGEKRLMPYFITVANNDRKEAQATIRQGNERVIRARLADGKFFYFDDQKTKLSDRKNDLEQLTFQEGLGSYLKKTERITKAGRWLSDSLKLEAKYSVCLERALELCKLDLVCNLVRELPELQGYVGSWYAEREGEPKEVSAAIASHYSPRSTDDQIPGDPVGCFTAVIDKLDHLVGLFSLGRRPSGSSDPYALRRNAQGLVDILLDPAGLASYAVDLPHLADLLLKEMAPLLAGKRGFDQVKVSQDLNEFLLSRVKMKLMQQGIAREVIDACCTSESVLSDLPSLSRRCKCLETLLKEDPTMKLVRVGVRIGNILKSDVDDKISPELFENEFEQKLWQKFKAEVEDKWQPAKDKETSLADLSRLAGLLNSLVPEIDLFFEKVMVNDPDEKKRKNRHALLHKINKHFLAIGDFSKLQPLLP